VSLIPPVLAILLAIAFRQVIPALLGGIWLGGWIFYGGPFVGFLRAIDTYLVGALVHKDHIAILIFSALLGGMVGVMSRSGGTRGLVDALSKRATNTRRGQVITWLLGLVIFFDDYTNTLVVGNTMRPVTDRLRVSREKLAYIVDSTAAPVASVALISTWIGFEVSLIGDSLTEVGSPEQPYWVFVQSIPYFFYPILALGFVLMVAWSGRDFGPMLHAERRAATGRLLADTAVPLSNFDHPDLVPPEGKPRRGLNAIAPVLVVLVVTFVSQYLTGRIAAAESGLDGSGLAGFAEVFSGGDPFRSLLYGAACGLIVAIVLARAQGILKLGDSIHAFVEGMKTMFLAFIILTLAWAIGKVCVDIGTADYLVSILRGNLDPRLLPALIFLLGAGISFSTGSSWSTMSILIPLAVPSAFTLATDAGFDPSTVHTILLGAVSAVLAGAIFGDHCSPISDTTILSSMASACDHVDHVKTQLPYAVVVAVVALLVGSIPSGYGFPAWLSLPIGLAVLWAALRFLGRPADAP
jgi:Na+/H+ antiporter NhaC